MTIAEMKERYDYDTPDGDLFYEAVNCIDAMDRVKDFGWLIDEVERLKNDEDKWIEREVLVCPEGVSFEIVIKQLQAREAKLVEALFDHRADLHCYSSRPCPTCRNSAEVLGIADKVPYCCAKEETDNKARAVLKEVSHD